MPDILIRGYSAPASCATCRFNSNAFCDVLGRKVKIPVDYVERPNTCPLVELPPHGDLISLDMALDECKKPTIYDLTDVPDFLRELPVVIPAEKGETQ